MLAVCSATQAHGAVEAAERLGKLRVRGQRADLVLPEFEIAAGQFVQFCLVRHRPGV